MARDLDWRIALATLGGGLFPVLLDAVVDRDWPDRSLARWIVSFVGLALIAAAAMVLERRARRRRAGSAG